MAGTRAAPDGAHDHLCDRGGRGCEHPATCASSGGIAPAPALRGCLLQLREAHPQNLFRSRPATLIFFDEKQLLRVGQASGNHHLAARPQLMKERRRNEIRSRSDDDLVERSMLGPPVIAVADSDLDIAHALPVETLLRLARELLDDFHAVDLACKLTENGGLVAQT